jgi:putative transposase
MTHDLVAFEDLNMEAMKKLWGKKISDRAFYFFIQKVRYLAGRYGCDFRQVDRFFPSSKLCSQCGHKKEVLALSERVYECGNCGSVMDRDINAATNLDNMGRALSIGLVEVRPQIRGALRVWVDKTHRKTESPDL